MGMATSSPSSVRPSLRSATVPLALLVGWTAFVWATRINNALSDAALDGAGKVVSLILSASMLALAAAAVVVLARAKHRDWTANEVRLVQVFVAWTVAVWVVRVPQILLADHDLGFSVVHTALGLVSIVLAVLSWPRARTTSA